MKTTTKVLIGASALLALVGALICYKIKTAEPSYQGKSLTEWVEKIDTNYKLRWAQTPKSLTNEVATALRAMGTNSLPKLIAWCNQPKSPIQNWIWEINKKQKYIQLRTGVAPYERKTQAVFAIAALGPIAKPAIPQLAALLYQTNSTIPAAAALVSLGSETHPIILQALSHSNCLIRVHTAFGIAWFGTEAAFAAPLLVSMLNDKENSVRVASAAALGRITNQPDVIVPALTKALADPSMGVKVRVAIALGEFGTNAAPALPALQQLLSQINLNSGLRAMIERTIRNISPPPPPPPSETP